MGPLRRNASHSYSPSSDSSTTPQSPQAYHQPSANQQQNLGMSPESRYQHNLKVLRRRDPSILSIFDQFSHVCLYHHNGQKWEKHGYEGSMFLYERDSYPPYGFYILNRMGMDDHIQRLYPEDNIGAHGSYLIIRSYPEFTARRLATAQASSSPALKDKFSDLYAVPNADKLTTAEKGDSETIGLWMFTTDSREPLYDVFSRLHSYIKRNAPYPQEFRYGPEKPPPSYITHGTQSDTVPQKPLTHQAYFPQEYLRNTSHSAPPVNCSREGISELDKLFAKIEPTPVLSSAVPAQPTSTSKMTIESLFAVLGGQDQAKSSNSSATAPPVPSRPSTASTGISLLDDIFASADPHKSRPATTQPTTSGSKPMTILSPAPTTNGVPQILSQDVISTLMGLPPSRTASAASTTCSSGGRSHPSSREGDNEDESDHGMENHTSDGGYSESSTILDADAESDEQIRLVGINTNASALAQASIRRVTSNGYLASGDGGRTQGDVTPRAPHPNGFTSPTSFAKSRHSSTLPPSLMSASSTSTVTAGPAARSTSELQPQIKTRPLVPFESDSELWPYNRVGNNNTNGANLETGSSGGADSDEVLELDFEDMSVLSDPDAFKKGVKAQHGRNAARNHNGAVTATNGKDADRWTGKLGKKEKLARARQEIEDSWDVPEYMRAAPRSSGTSNSNGFPPAIAPYKRNGLSAGNGNGVGGATGRAATTDEDDHSVMSAPASPSPSPSPMSTPVRVPEVQPHRPPVHPVKDPETQRAPAAAGNGLVNGTGKQQGAVDANAVRDSILSSVVGHGVRGGLQRNDFVREVLTLIHTDKTFVDSLWKDYTHRIA